MAARSQAKVSLGHLQLPETDELYAENIHWACKTMNHNACSANSDSVHRMRCGMENLVLIDRIRF